MTGEAQPFESRKREKRGVGGAPLKFREPRLDIAAEVDDLKVRAQAPDLRLAPQRRAADDRPPRQRRKRLSLAADEGIADVGPRENRRD